MCRLAYHLPTDGTGNSAPRKPRGLGHTVKFHPGMRVYLYGGIYTGLQGLGPHRAAPKQSGCSQIPRIYNCVEPDTHAGPPKGLAARSLRACLWSLRRPFHGVPLVWIPPPYWPVKGLSSLFCSVPVFSARCPRRPRSLARSNGPSASGSIMIFTLST